jgi:RNA polymerase-binding transcription factor DksA
MGDFEAFRGLLLDRREGVLASVTELGGTIESIVSAREGSNSDDEHDPEGTTLAFERSQSDALFQQAMLRLKDIDAALARLDAGTYGRCEVCGEPIAPARLTARPEARTCVACGEKTARMR